MNPITIILLVLVALSAALAMPHEHEHQVPNYHYEYGVHDPHTHDHKSQHEHRHHDDVKGGYFLDQPDGTKRVVEYDSHHKEGFGAQVRREGHAKHPHHGTSYVKDPHWGRGSGK